ncbi:unnamed protein product [Fusarium graminearum]|uniref:Uncharacterized protein n=1 Tax=Gibberella zeae TaxID=5518 RepID=A0A4E9D356_GIBZA|nr:unnamed protein product [Fusarium graminearum]CAF3602970.1 unnamed protein product [Fusarium graminearum]CAG1969443.1 unnamed protein product [Fusarium graminearum]CAG1984530.1 unnamed protein product [Fusarium graminearum]
MPVCKTQPLSTTSLLNQCWTVRPYAPRFSNVEIDESNKLNTAETEILRSPAFRRNKSTWVDTDGSHIGIRSSCLYWIACRGIDEMGWEVDIRYCI